MLSNIAGAAYWQRCLDKAREVSQEGLKRQRHNQSEKERLADEMRDLMAKINEQKGRLAGIADFSSSAPISLESILQQCQRHGLTAPSSGEIDENSLLDALEGFAQELLSARRRKSADLADILTLLPQHAVRLAQRDQIQSSLRNELEIQSKNISEEQNLLAALQREQSTFSTIHQEIERLSSRLETLRTAPGLFEKSASFLRQIQTDTQALAEIEASFSTNSKNLRDTGDALTKLRESIDLKARDLVTLRGRTVLLNEIYNEASYYFSRRQSIDSQAQLEQEIAANMQTIENERATFVALQKQLEERKHGLEAKLASTSSVNQSAINSINALRNLDTDGTCGLCGQTYASHSDLQLHIDKQLLKLSHIASEIQTEILQVQDHLGLTP